MRDKRDELQELTESILQEVNTRTGQGITKAVNILRDAVLLLLKIAFPSNESRIIITEQGLKIEMRNELTDDEIEFARQILTAVKRRLDYEHEN